MSRQKLYQHSEQPIILYYIMNMTKKKLLVSPLHPLELNILFPLTTFIIEVIFFVSPGVYKVDS
jgi:hypothetical protein